MPQPLSKVSPSAGYSLANGNAPFPPDIAILALSVVNYWSQIDAQMAALLAKIMKAEPRSAIAMYGAVLNADARRGMVLAAAQEILDFDTYVLIKATLESCKASKKQRNSIVHDLWGILSDGSNLLISVEAQTMAAYNGMIEAHTNTISSVVLAQNQTPQPLKQIDRSKIMTWNPADFQKAADLAQYCLGKVARLPFLITHPSSATMRQKLLADSQIARLHSKYLKNTQ